MTAGAWSRYGTGATPRLRSAARSGRRPTWAERPAAELDTLVFERHARLPGISDRLRRHCEARAEETRQRVRELVAREQETPATWVVEPAVTTEWTRERLVEYARWFAAALLLAVTVACLTILLYRLVWWAWPVR